MSMSILTNNNYMLTAIALSALIIILIGIILNFVALYKIGNVKKRIDKFMSDKSETLNFEEMLIKHSNNINLLSEKYSQSEKLMDIKYNKLAEGIDSINSRMKFCVQKVGLVRYNPFEDVGGEFSFAIAFLDDENNGVVLNSIYSREGCYTYAKPIEKGVCVKYKLSEEEEQAIKIAKKI